MPCTAKTLVNYAKSWNGATGGDGRHKQIIDGYNKIRPLPRNYKVKYTDSWCATFVTFCFNSVGALDIVPSECSCQKMIDKAKKMGIWVEDDNHSPALGDIIFYDWQDNGVGDNKGWSDHVGIVCDTNGTNFVVIEGNNGNKVAYRSLTRNAKYIRGFACPKFLNDVQATISNVVGLDYDKVVKEVIDGKWGHGATRRQRLTAAGYAWRKVQNAVNEYYGSSVRY